MQYRNIPGTSMSVSSLALGGWLTFGEGVEDAESLSILHTAVDSGVTFLDLADVYAEGRAESVVGRFLREVDRDRLVVSSKVFWPTSDDPGDRGLSRRHIHASIDRTLARLHTDHLDLYFCHREDPSVDLAETVQAMGDLIAAGKVRAWGTSCWQPATLREAHRLASQLGVAPPRVEQPSYNLLERWIEADLLPCCAELDMAVVVWSPLAGGALTGKYLDGVPPGSRAANSQWLDAYLRPSARKAVSAFVGFCRERGVEPAVMALAWVMQQPGITAAITGASSKIQLQDNLPAVACTLEEQDLARLDHWFRRGRRSWWRRLLGALRRR
ncbi:MAG: aryl-alcohol dehydrogenase-like predicted oxidoreductase [Hyphomicrobiaceae bacterium]